MSSITSATQGGSSTTGAAAAATGGTALGKDDFIKLLMTQMQNQDPLNPTDNTQYVAELAQFSSLEQMSNMNSTLGQVLTAQASGNQMNTASLVGKSVEVSGNTVAFNGTTSATVSGTLSSPASTVTATITDSTGKVVRTLTDSIPSPSGNWSTSWDGKDSVGTMLPPGNYTVSLAAADAAGNAVTANPVTYGVVSGVSFANGAAQLVVNGKNVPLSSVVEIDQAPVAASTASGSTASTP